jgi:hypothetical protein
MDKPALAEGLAAIHVLWRGRFSNISHYIAAAQASPRPAPERKWAGGKIALFNRGELRGVGFVLRN